MGLRPQLLGKPRKVIFEFINFTSMYKFHTCIRVSQKGLLMLTLRFTEGSTHVDVVLLSCCSVLYFGGAVAFKQKGRLTSLSSLSS